MSRHDGKVWVRKLRTGYSSHPWEVRARNLNGYDYYETFYSWREALDYADRLARTREVVLPRNPLPLTLPREHGEPPVKVTQEWVKSLVYLYDNYSGDVVALYPQDLRLLAPALLAIAEQEKHA